jgi:hypothetical protein
MSAAQTKYMGEHGEVLVEQTVDELARWMTARSMPPGETAAASLMLPIHYLFEITMERLGPAGVHYMLESAELFAKQAITGEVQG